MTNNIRNTATELIKSLHDLVCGDDIDKAATMPMDEVYSYLKRNNVAYDQVIKDVQTRLNKMKTKAKLDEAREIRETLLEKLNGVLPSTEHIKQNIKGLIDKMMFSNPESASAFFRKYESATEKDLESLYQDLLSLQQLDKNDAEK